MNNCPKCGNQLQEGVTVCSICGTNILENKTEVAQAPQQTAQPAQAAQPVQPAQPAAAPAPTPETQPATETPTAEAIAPNVERVTATTPVPSIPTSLSNSSEHKETKLEEDGPKLTKKPKAGINKGIIIAFLIIALVGVGGYIYMSMSGSSMKGGTDGNEPPTGDYAGTKVSSNGFKFNLINGWIINEDGEHVVVINESSTVAIKLVYSKANLADVSRDQIDDILNEKEIYKDTEINELKLTGRDTYQVNTVVNDIPVQVYFINGGSDLTLGATVVYQTKESKSKYEPEVTEMIGSLSYSNDSIKALDVMSSYSEMFSVYDKVMGSIEPTETPIPDLPDKPEEPTSDEEDDENKPEEKPEDKPEEKPENKPEEKPRDA